MTQELAQMAAPRARRRPAREDGSWLRRLIYFHVIRRMRSYGISVLMDMLCVAAAYEMVILIRYAGTSVDSHQLTNVLIESLFCALIYVVISYLLGMHRRLWRYASLKDGFALMRAVVALGMVVAILDFAGVPVFQVAPPSIILGGTFLSFLFLGSMKVLPRALRLSRASQARRASTRVLIVGAGQAGATLASRFLLSGQDGYRVIGFVDDDSTKWGGRIHGLPVIGAVEVIPDVVKRNAVDLIAIALPAAGPERISEILTFCQETPASIKILPGLKELVGQQPPSSYLREVDVADLLGREVVPLRSDEARWMLEGKTVLVTGAAGSIGSELCRQLINYGPDSVIALDTNETGLFDLAEGVRGQPHAERLKLRIADITHAETISRIFATSRPDVVYHAAAYKHVPLLEDHPDQALRTNVLGTFQLCQLASDHGVGRFVFISSDKAAAPVNILGASKRAGELIVQAMSWADGDKTQFRGVRFGNVIGSRGSVVPTFTRQIEQGGPVTVTDPEVTRYFMTIPEACGLVILASAMEDGGLYLLDMGEPVRIADLATKMIRLRGLRVNQDIPIVFTGLRPGERLHELLASGDERLVPTANDKISRLESNTSMLSVQQIESAMRDLRGLLTRESDLEALRDWLFAFCRSGDDPAMVIQATVTGSAPYGVLVASPAAVSHRSGELGNGA